MEAKETLKIPFELIEMIVKSLDAINDKATILNIALTNKQNYNAFIPLIYETINLTYIPRLEKLLSSLLESRNIGDFKRLEMIKCLDLSTLSLISMQLIGNLFSILGPHLERIDVSNVINLYDSYIGDLCKHRKLKSITFNSNYNIPGYCFEPIVQYLGDSLIELELKNLNKIHYSQIIQLVQGLPNLKHLTLVGFKEIAPVRLRKILRKIRSNLESLTLLGMPFSLETFEPIHHLIYNNIHTLEISLSYKFDISDLINLFSLNGTTSNIKKLIIHLNNIIDDYLDLPKQLKPLKKLLPKLIFLGIKGVQTKLLELDTFINEWTHLKYFLFCPSSNLSKKIETSFRKKAKFQLIVYT